MKKIFVFLLLNQVCFAQNQDTKNLMLEADKAFVANDFEMARTKYLNVTVSDSLNKTAWYNLAAAELNLGQNESACVHLYKSYKLKNIEAGALIKQYCVEIKNGTVMSLKDVDEKPQFLFDNKFVPLFQENGSLNISYSKLIAQEIKKSETLKRFKGKIFITLQVNTKSEFDGEILRVNSNEGNIEAIKSELLKIMKFSIQYKPATYKGRAVEVWDKIALPLNFGS